MGIREQEILLVMRKTLTNIIREITPEAGRPYPLSEDTVSSIRDCLKLLALRERELGDIAGIAAEQPFYKDQPQSGSVTLPISDIVGRSSKDDD